MIDVEVAGPESADFKFDILCSDYTSHDCFPFADSSPLFLN
jgi:hypothetical protein